ncbi:MAG TPA: M23 family metallopeptidase [Chloroflexia bacterium]|nr:M23 family metallopeptidase [Chloroflexia bacterium]
MEQIKTLLSRRRLLGMGLAAGAGIILGSEQPTEIIKVAHGQAAPFSLPFSGPPGPATWYLRQWYGNTRWAYRQHRALYSQGQGLHFGVDFWTPCGSEALAIADGTVISIDGPYGSAPHNLLIRHSNGLVSLYGHLLKRSSLRVGQSVRQGEPVGTTGAPSGADCDTHPHLHLEIREGNLGGTRNPVTLINADWYNLTLGVPSEGLQFQIDLDNPARWQNIYDQPNVRFGGALLNDYARSWP